MVALTLLLGSYTTANSQTYLRDVDNNKVTTTDLGGGHRGLDVNATVAIGAGSTVKLVDDNGDDFAVVGNPAYVTLTNTLLATTQPRGTEQSATRSATGDFFTVDMTGYTYLVVELTGTFSTTFVSAYTGSTNPPSASDASAMWIGPASQTIATLLVAAKGVYYVTSAYTYVTLNLTTNVGGNNITVKATPMTGTPPVGSITTVTATQGATTSSTGWKMRLFNAANAQTGELTNPLYTQLSDGASAVGGSGNPLYTQFATPPSVTLGSGSATVGKVDQGATGTDPWAMKSVVVDSDTTQVNLASFGSYTTKTFDMTKGQSLSVHLTVAQSVSLAGIFSIQQSVDGVTWEAVGGTTAAFTFLVDSTLLQPIKITGFTLSALYGRVTYLNYGGTSTTTFRLQTTQVGGPAQVANQGMGGLSPWLASIDVGAVTNGGGSRAAPLWTGPRYEMLRSETPLSAGGCVYVSQGCNLGQTTYPTTEYVSVGMNADAPGTLRFFEATDGLPSKLSLQLPYVNVNQNQQMNYHLGQVGYNVEYTNGATAQTLWGINVLLATTPPVNQADWTFALSTTLGAYTSDVVIANSGKYANTSVFITSDAPGTLYVDESSDGYGWKSTPFPVPANQTFKLSNYKRLSNQMQIRFVPGGPQSTFYIVGTVSNSEPSGAITVTPAPPNPTALSIADSMNILAQSAGYAQMMAIANEGYNTLIKGGGGIR